MAKSVVGENFSGIVSRGIIYNNYRKMMLRSDSGRILDDLEIAEDADPHYKLAQG